MSKTAAARYTQGPTMTTDSRAAQPARPRDPDRQAPPTTFRPAQPLAELRPRLGLDLSQLAAAAFACHSSALEVEPQRPAFQGRLCLYGNMEASLQLRTLVALPGGQGSVRSTHIVAYNL